MDLQTRKKWRFIFENKIHALFLILLLLTTQNAFSQTNSPLQSQRNEVIKQYVHWLGEGNYKAISLLFTKKAIAVSSSGISDTPMHFYQTLFTKTITSPISSFINLFAGTPNPDMMTAYFDFSWNNQAGKNVSAKFLDLFVFEKGTTKLSAVFVFSNTFQEDIMKQLNS